MEADRVQIRDRVEGRALVHAEPLRHHVHVVEEVVLTGRGLVDRAHNSVTLSGELLQYLDKVLGRGAV